jgi:hypothetical protein
LRRREDEALGWCGNISSSTNRNTVRPIRGIRNSFNSICTRKQQANACPTLQLFGGSLQSLSYRQPTLALAQVRMVSRATSREVLELGAELRQVPALHSVSSCVSVRGSGSLKPTSVLRQLSGSCKAGTSWSLSCSTTTTVQHLPKLDHHHQHFNSTTNRIANVSPLKPAIRLPRSTRALVSAL